MKKTSFLLLVTILLTGCDYKVPATTEASSPANKELAGTWISKSDDGTSVLVDIKVSGDTYTVKYTEKSESLNFKGMNIEIDGVPLIQMELQCAGAPENSVSPYFFFKYEITPDGLLMYRVNTGVVSALCQTSEELRKSIGVHKKNTFLYQDPILFTRSQPE